MCNSAYSQIDKGNKKPVYSVKVDVKEVKNRTLECKVRNHTVYVDQPKSFGADDTAPTPPEMLAVSFGSCIVSTIQFIAFQKNISIHNISVTVEGDIDFSKAMCKSDENRAGFMGLKANIKFDAAMSIKEKQELIDKMFNLGAVIDNIRNTTPIEYNVVE